MAYNSSIAQLRKILDLGLASAGSLWVYESTHSHSAVEVGGFFTGCGRGSPSSNCVGAAVGDLVLAINQSTAGTSAITWHRITSLSTSTGFNSPINATVSADST